MADDGGMSVGGATEAPPETGFPDLNDDPERGFEPPEGDGGDKGGEAEQSAADWIAGLDDETRRYVEGKGFKDVATLVRSAREAESNMHRERQLVEEYERAFQQMGQQGQQQQGQQDAGPDLGQAISQAATNIRQRYESGKLDEGEALEQMGSLMSEALAAQQGLIGQMIDARLGEFESERVAPLQTNQWQQHWQREARSLQTDLGADEYRRLAPQAKDVLSDMIRRDDSMRENPDAMRLAFARVIADESISKRREASAQTIQGGGRSRAKQVDPAEEIIKGMEEVAPKGFSGGIL